VYTGVSSIGQSGETAIAQLCSEALGIDYEHICVHSGDTATSPLNTGAFASRTLIAVAELCERRRKLSKPKYCDWRPGLWRPRPTN
jgi:carbon-monoxide dehydrogenase large subunit